MSQAAQVHLCLIRDTAISNLLPALDAAIKPSQVVFLYGNSMRRQVVAMRKILESHEISVASYPVANAWDPTQIRQEVESILDDHAGQTIALNASGGTRPMSLAAYEVFQERGLPVFFINYRSNQLTWLHDRDLPPLKLDAQMDIRDYLGAHGADVEAMQMRSTLFAGQHKITALLIDHLQRYEKPLGTLNWLAKKAENSLLSPSLTGKQLRWKELQELLGHLQRAGLCQVEKEGIRFRDEDARFFINGGWIECYVHNILERMQKEGVAIQQVARSVQIVRDADGRAVPNELDVAFLYANRLFIVECKTKRFASRKSARFYDTPGADVLYKMDSLKGVLGGLRTRVMLVSYHPLSHWNKRRAHDLGIRLLQGNGLQKLRQAISEMIGV